MPFWAINHDSVSADCLEGEVVAIHLGTGIYYSLRGPAAAVWQALGQPADTAVLAAVLAAQFAVTPSRAEQDAADFLGRLLAENLVVASDTTAPAGEAPAPAPERATYAPPELERFADLQDLLLLDPIHDVGAQGWPHRPKPPEKQGGA